MTRSATARGLVFGTVAESYERFRLGYPDEVVDRTVRYAARPVRTAVEVGAGTGKATRAFASRDIAVTAIEPDPDMFSVLERETAGMPVTPVRSTYEEYDGPPADLLYAASAMHWTAPASRWTHAARLLLPGGVVAVFGAEMRLADELMLWHQHVTREHLLDEVGEASRLLDARKRLVRVAVVAQEAAPCVLEGGAHGVVGQPHLGPEDGDHAAGEEQPRGVRPA